MWLEYSMQINWIRQSDSSATPPFKTSYFASPSLHSQWQKLSSGRLFRLSLVDDMKNSYFFRCCCFHCIRDLRLAYGIIQWLHDYPITRLIIYYCCAMSERMQSGEWMTMCNRIGNNKEKHENLIFENHGLCCGMQSNWWMHTKCP